MLDYKGGAVRIWWSDAPGAGNSLSPGLAVGEPVVPRLVTTQFPFKEFADDWVELPTVSHSTYRITKLFTENNSLILTIHTKKREPSILSGPLRLGFAGHDSIRRLLSTRPAV